MMRTFICTLFCLLGLSAPVLAVSDAARWVTFKTGQGSDGRMEYQIDRNTIRREGPYSTFWARIWVVSLRQPRVFSINEQLIFWSQKFAVDCPHHVYGLGFIDSTYPSEKKRAAKLEAMHWKSLDKAPAISGAVCGK
jgi:hypothetical protein